VAPAFRTGEFFEKGETLLEIDKRDYETAVITAEATLARARLALAEEEANAAQARTDWGRLNPGIEPPELVSREPQLAQARADVASAEARVENARLNLERTTITAPYAGRILEKRVDIGQFVNSGSALAEIYAVDYAEIRLPLSEREIGFIDVPELYRDDSSLARSMPKVALTTTIGNETLEWSGRIVRAEGAFDVQSRQLFFVAQVDDPYRKQGDGRPPLKVGSFVQAKIEGKVLENVIVIPRDLYRKNEYVVVIEEDGTLRRKSIEIEWSDEENLVVSSGLNPGDRVCLTHLSFPSEGMKVAVVFEDGIDVADRSIPESGDAEQVVQ
jgi:RND family efflux transporter MFP subunit